MESVRGNPPRGERNIVAGVGGGGGREQEVMGGPEAACQGGEGGQDWSMAYGPVGWRKYFKQSAECRQGSGPARSHPRNSRTGCVHPRSKEILGQERAGVGVGVGCRSCGGTLRKALGRWEGHQARMLDPSLNGREARLL